MDAAVRVAVGTDPGPRSNVWRIWSHNDEIHAGARSIVGDVKTSFHSSGRHRHVFTDESRSGLRPEGDRAWQEWREPAEFTMGARYLLEIVVPTEELSTPLVEPPTREKEKIELVEPASDGELTVLSLVVTDSDLEVDRFPHPDGWRNPRLVWTRDTPDGRTLWVVASHLESSPELAQLIAGARSDIARRLAGHELAVADHPRLFVWVHDEERALARFFDLAP